MNDSAGPGFFERLLGIEEATVPYTLHGDGGFSLVVSCTGSLGFHDCTVSLVAYGDKKKGKEIECDIKWLKVLGVSSYQIKDYHERYFNISPHDIGISIQAAITSKDPRYPGSKTFSIPNIKMNAAIQPEIEGLLLNHQSSFRIYAIHIQENSDPQSLIKFPPNVSFLELQRPYMIVRFDPVMQTRKHLVTLAQDRQINMLLNSSMKFELDKRNTTAATLVFTEEINETTGKPLPNAVMTRIRIRFDSRMQRDICFIYSELTRLLQPRVVEELLAVYNNLVRVPWSFLLPRSEYASELGLTFDSVLSKDLIRDQLKSMVRIHNELSQENIRLMDSVEILEADLVLAASELKKLIDDAIKAKENKRGLTKRELSRYEISNQSIMQETSMIVDGVRVKGNKRKARQLDTSRHDALREQEEELAGLKNYNTLLKKEIEGMRASAKGGMTKQSEVSIFRADVSEIKGHQNTNATISTEYLQRKALRDVINRYNKKAAKRLEDLKEVTRGYKELQRRFEASLTNETYTAGLPSSSDIHTLFLAAAISHYYAGCQDYKETLGMMQKYYNVDIKLQVLREIVETDDVPTQSQPTESLVTVGTRGEEEGLGLEQEELDRLKEELAVLEEEQLRLNTEVTNQSKRADLIERGLKKTKEEVAAKQKEDYDRKIAEMETQLAEVMQEYELLKSVV